MNSHKLLDDILPDMTEEFKNLLGALSELGRTPNVEEMETYIHAGMLKIGACIMQAVVGASGSGYQGRRIRCKCGASAKFHSVRKRTVQTTIGTPTFARAYYYCESCGGGISPLDEELGITRKGISKRLERSICRLAAVEPFFSVAEDIYEFTGASVCAKTVQVVSEAAGETVQAARKQEAHEAIYGKIKIQAEDKPSVLCISMDGKMICTPSGLREMKVGAVYDLVPPIKPRKDGKEQEPGRTTYLGEFAEAESFGESMWAEGIRRGADLATRLSVLGDGAVWIWNQADTHWPRATQILDYYHAAEHMWELGNALYEQGTKRTNGFVTYKLDQIWAGKVGKVITALSKLKTDTKEKEKKLKDTIHYFTVNAKRMQYPKYRKMGLHIGSGVVESACKQFGARLDQAGMRWTEKGAGAIAALRSLKLSQRWDQYWQPVRYPLLA
jgi:hypothetical protein